MSDEQTTKVPELNEYWVNRIREACEQDSWQNLPGEVIAYRKVALPKEWVLQLLDALSRD